MAGACACGDGEVVLVYACSGAANTGLLADRVMRALSAKGTANGSCLAGIGADLSGFILSARDAAGNIVIDGCKVSCGRKAFEKNGIACQQFVMTDFGVEKGKTAITEELAEGIAERIAGMVKP
jgi:uncharacterized metal-binding protein